MKKMTLIFFLFIFSFSLYSQENVGVMDITPKQGVSEMEADIVTDFVYNALYRYSGGRYMIISRQNREAILAEHAFSLSGFCDDASCALEVGKYLSADYVIIGSFTKFGSKYYLSLQLVNVNTTAVTGSAREGADDLDGIAATAVDACVAGVFGGSVSSGRPGAVESIRDVRIGEHYAGGIVFYLNSTGGGLVCAESDQNVDCKWGGKGSKMGCPDTEIGTGTVNTAVIELKLINSDSAASLCADLELNGYDDWFLPSKDELNLMYLNLHKNGLGNFANLGYWSSSEFGANDAWWQSFFNGSQNFSSKDNTLHVRAVRAFGGR